MAKDGSKRKKGATVSDRKSDARARKPRKASAAGAIAKLADHPLITELLAAGAMAAVSTIADHRLAQQAGGNSKKDGKVVKAAGRAAAAAIGARLLSEIRKSKPKT